MTNKLDKKDWKILYYLCTDSRISHIKLAKKVRLSKNAVTYRIRKLEKNGVIAGYFTGINSELLGAVAYTILCKLNRLDSDFIKFLKTNPNISVADGFVGTWNVLIEFVCTNPYDVFEFLSVLKTKFSGIIESYEMHPILEMYDVEQLPVELVKTKEISPRKRWKIITLDNTEKILLSELNKNSSASLIYLAKKAEINYKTVASRLKSLKKRGIIQKFTANIDLYHLGYKLYLIFLDFRNLSTQTEQELKSFLLSQTNLRASFISASKPRVFMYVAVKDPDMLGDFLLLINEKFGSKLLDTEILLGSDQWKYDLFPTGILKNSESI